MTRMNCVKALTAAVLLSAPMAAHASDERFELWLNQALDYSIDAENTVELVTGQRFSSAADGGTDSYYLRGWLHHRVNSSFTISAAIEQRENDGGFDEVRLLQQLSGRHGVLRTRLRVEQRWIEDQSRMGLRLRPRVGVAVPVDEAGKWQLSSDAELSFTLRSSRIGPADDAGLRGMRLRLGATYQASENLAVNLTYVRNQKFVEGAGDVVGNAPLLGLAYSF